MNARLIAFPSDEILQAELLSLRYDVTSSGQVKLESKRAIRKKGMPSPDRADALALAFMRPPSLQIWTGYEPFLRPRPLAGVPYYAPLPPDPPDDDGGDDEDDDGGDINRHSGVGRNPEGAGDGARAP